MRCSCSATLRWLCEHGARHACAQRKEQRAELHWSAEDWLEHFDEEERLFCPRLPAPVAAKIREDHRRFRAQIRASGQVDLREMSDHAALEDKWASYLKARERKKR
jgi:hypothetical protein